MDKIFDIINMNNDDKSNPSVLLKVLVVFYILIGSSLLQPLLSKQWKELVSDNRIVQHIIGITTLIALTTLLSDGKMDNITILLYSLVGYLWFIFSTKLDVHWNIAIMIMLTIAYLYYNSLERKNKLTEQDKILTESEKQTIIKSNSNNTLIVMLVILIVTVGGVTLYSNKKEVQYGGGYSLINFLFY